MHIPASLIVLTTVILSLLLIFTIAIDESLPAFIRTDFDAISTRYFSKLIINGGLTSTDVQDLENELNDLKLKSININIYADDNNGISVSPGSTIEWGRKATLSIETIYEYDTVSTDGKGSKGTKQHTLKYKNSSTILSLNNN